ncbi:MAG: hypothetical protein A3J07_02130 [Candidatus Doudnabacteria bacterium RIFCSPLOWO2_02_FULL_49_13]|uniref:Uncharacterized protein n=1 Tax=Candidatus Doudnabacteria bacterium RIFCSPHIGHO2_12_FULL_48_16 TaxID=1817838 RepID=A0A1F5PM38_9BACT|nr:MAG: hypothetical protein A3B77_00580 [Candidatus Doudnabacteria bacterium RIFCSPHIGHO2_02_FULL_49_24]OGE90732.1 MAG: hypothetical protein A3E29_01230 [Candidatus Doudnabacteria bacterium RIFCSPHIGHO2_12_FULL_48_16]OGF02595.1 MAG: hypothetical protein A3J07_02130 [Candidatus Doudnabacteria bacterium RIFCSPLOWO2_02_FULL_49_13]
MEITNIKFQMTNKLKLTIIFSVLLFAGLFIAAKSAKAATYIDWFPTPTGLVGSCGGAGTTASMSWNAMPPYDAYFRIADDTAGGAYLTSFWIPENKPYTGPSTSISTTPGHSYHWWIHARDGWGNWGPQSDGYYTCANPPPPPPPPTCSSATPDGTAVYGNTTQRVNANGVANATAVLFPTWSESGGQDDIVWYDGTNAGSGTWYIDINMSSHPGYGTVFTHAYMSNATTGDTYCDQATYTTYAPYTIGFTADPTSIAFGGSSTLAWSTASTTSCAVGKVSGPGPTPPGGTGGVSGTWTATNITGETTYNISCSGVAGGNPGATVTVTVAASQQATGVLESNTNSTNNNSNCATMSGWAWDPDFSDTAIQIHIYHNGSFYTNISAGDFRGDLPGNKNHGFTYTIPSAWKDGASHTINMYAIDLNSGGNPDLIYSPVSAFVCALPTVDIKANGSDGPISINNNTSATLSWTSINTTSCSLYVTGGGLNNADTGWTGTAQPSVATGNMTTNNTYRVDCTGANGTATDTVIININAQPTCTGGSAAGTWTTSASTMVVSATGVANATAVQFPIWSDQDGQDDIIWYQGANAGGGTWTATVILNNHSGLGVMNVHVYATNENYGTSLGACGSASFTKLNQGTIEVNSSTPTTWTITCPLTSPACPSVSAGGGSSTGSYSAKPYSSWTITPANKPGYNWQVNNCPVNTPCTQNFPP